MVLFVVELPLILLLRLFASLIAVACSELFDSLLSIDVPDSLLLLVAGSLNVDKDTDFDVVVVVVVVDVVAVITVDFLFSES